MAVQSAKTLKNDEVMMIVRWSNLANGDTGSWLQIPYGAEKCAIAYGTFGAGGSIAIEGANEIIASPANAIPLHNPGETVIALTSSGQVQQVLESTFQIRPHVTAGDGTTLLTVDLMIMRTAIP